MIGKTIKHYKIREKLGEGGMGIVYRAEDTKLKRQVALKFLPAEYISDPQAKRRFLQEARAASTLDHPCICTIHEIDETSDNGIFIAMTYYEGRSLKDLIADGALNMERALEVIMQIAEGLAKAHEMKIVHRDIKPANILFTNEGQVKIVDFGLAKFIGQAKLTKTGTAVGTTAYMSPEQARGEEVDYQTDIWSLGVILYEMLTGQLPFRGDYEQAIVYMILNEQPVNVRRIKPTIPPQLEKIIDKALAKEKENRYKHVNEFLMDLKPLRTNIESQIMKQDISVTEGIPSIAVLPFVNMSPDPENEYFGDGLAEELLNALTRLEGLRVAARTSAFSFRGKDVDIREIGRKLDVATVLEGSVRKAGDRVRVTAQLINIADGYHLWSERYDREMNDIFALQDEITLAIIEQLKIKLMPGKAGSPVVKRYTESLEAYSLLLKGRYYWHSLTSEGWVRSRECFEKAVELDSNYALAYTWLAIWLQSKSFWGDVSPASSYKLGQQSLKKALQIDDTVSEAHNVLAVNCFSFEWDWKAAEHEFLRSLELDPHSAMARINYAIFLIIQDRFDEALTQAELAQKLDPLSPMVNTWAALVPLYAGRAEDALRQLHVAMELDPDYWQPYIHMASAYLNLSEWDKAVASAQKAVELSGGASISSMLLACAYYRAGRLSEAEEQLDLLKKKAQKAYVAPMFFAWIYQMRGEVDAAYHWLKQAVDSHDAWTSWYKVGGPGGIRFTDPKVTELMKSAGLE